MIAQNYNRSTNVAMEHNGLYWRRKGLVVLLFNFAQMLISIPKVQI